MEYDIGDEVNCIDLPSQVGVVARLNPAGVANGIVVRWNDGPLFSDGDLWAYVYNRLSELQLNV